MSFVQVGLRFGPNDEARGHRSCRREASMRARTSAHGDPSPGSRRYPSARRSSSARCASVIGGSAESAGRLSQRAIARSTRCEGVSRVKSNRGCAIPWNLSLRRAAGNNVVGAWLTPQLSSGRPIKCERSELPQPPGCFNVR
jgi:hypothetical protein